MSAQVQTWLSPEQYLEIEQAATTRSEYFNGRMYAMVGGKYNHARIGPNLSGELYMALKKSSCEVVSSDMRIRVSPSGLLLIPTLPLYAESPSSPTIRETLW